MRLLLRCAWFAVVFASGAGIASAGQVTAGGASGGGRAGGGGPGVTTSINGPSTITPPMTPGNAAISGAVTDGVTGRPLANAVVTLALQMTDPNGAPRRVLPLNQTTDSKGRFVFTDLPAGDRFVLTATHLAYFDGGYGRRPDTDAASAPKIVIADRQWFNRADVQLWPAGAITGTVTDEHGDPVVGAYVRVLRQFVVAGTKEVAAGPIGTTDDRGQYRIYGLDPGTYLVNVPSVQSSVPISAPVAGTEPALDRDGTSRHVIGRYPTAPSSGEGPVVYASAFHPSGSTIAQAEAVTIEYGSSPTGVDIRLEPVRAFRVAGRVDGPIDIASKMTLRLMAPGAEDLSLGAETATALVAADGSFVFLDVPIGDYTLDARGTTTEFQIGGSFNGPRIPTTAGWAGSSATTNTITGGPANMNLRTIGSAGSNKYWARLPVHVTGRDVPNLVLTLRPAVSLSGRIVFEGTAPQPSFVSVNAESADARPSLGALQNRLAPSEASNQFQIDGLLQGDYFLRPRPSDPWVVKSIVSGGHDYAAQPFDATAGHDFSDIVVTLTDQAAAIAGSVHGAGGTPVDSAAVIVFPADRAGWTHYGFSPDRIKATIANTGGSFRFANLPAGSYLVVAVDRSKLRAWQDPAFLEAAAKQATHVTIDWGETGSADLSVVTIR
jgi:protocatechuate 3,4-dioxygenase beta subunit